MFIRLYNKINQIFDDNLSKITDYWLHNVKKSQKTTSYIFFIFLVL